MPESGACGLCAGANIDFYTKAVSLYSEDIYDIVKCRDCGLVFVDDSRRTDWRLENYRDDKTAVEYMDGKEGRDKIAFSPLLMKLAGLVKAGDVHLLDIGCGSGTLLGMARAAGWQVTGIEPNVHIARIAEEKHGIKVFTCTLEEADLASESFDVITVIQTLEHMYDPLRTLRVARDILKKDGILYVEVPNLYNFAFILNRRLGVRDFARTLDPAAHVYYFTPGTLKRLITGAGFVPLEIEAGFNEALLEIFIKDKALRALAKIPYKVLCFFTSLAKIGMGISVVAAKK